MWTSRLPGSALAWLACALLGGCTALGPDFKRPAVPWLADWSGGAQRALPAADAQARAQPPAAVDAWWTNFGDPVLEQVVTQAQRQNPGVRIAAVRILESRALLGIAGSGLYPQVQEVSASALRTPGSWGPRKWGSGRNTASRAALPAARTSRAPP